MAAGCVSLPVAILVVAFYGAAILKSAESRDRNNSPFNWISNRHHSFNTLLESYGANMCASVTVAGTPPRSYYSECMSVAPTKICEKPTKQSVHCCTGYDKEYPSARGCTVVKPVVDLNNTLLDLKLNSFHEAWENVDPSLELMITDDKDRVVTMFVPQNSAFKTETEDIKSELNLSGNENLVYQHVVQNRLTTSDLVNNALLSSAYKGKGSIRINRYAGGILTANCARVLMPNQVATNGIIHITEKFVMPMEETVWKVIESHPNLTKFEGYLIKAKLDKKLKDPGCLTVFAPTDEAFENMDKEVKKVIDTNDLALKNLLMYHIVECCICSAAIYTWSNPSTLEGHKLHLRCNVQDFFMANEATAIETDFVAKNGIVHVIDKVLIPDSARSLASKLEEQGLTEFIELVKEAGMYDMMSGRAQLTVFAPSNNELRGLSKELKKDKKLLKAFVCNHIVMGLYTTSKLIGVKYIQTINKDVDYADKLFVNVYQKEFGVNNAMLVKADYVVANGILQVINEALRPASMSIYVALSENTDLSTFYELVQLSGIMELGSSAEGKQWTVLAPSNVAMMSLGEKELKRLKSSEGARAKFLQKHIIERAIFPVLFRESLTYRYLTGSTLKWEFKHEGSSIRISGSTHAFSKDLCTDGVLYTINRCMK